MINSGLLTDRVANSRYYDVDIYNGSEDWMGIQIDYTVYDGNKYEYPRRFGVGLIDFLPITPTCYDVIVWDDTCSDYETLGRVESHGKAYEMFSGGIMGDMEIVQILNLIESHFN